MARKYLLTDGDTSSTYDPSGTGAVNGQAITAAIESLDVTDSSEDGKYVSSVSETDGKIIVAKEDFPTHLSGDIAIPESATENQVLTFDGENWIAKNSQGGSSYTLPTASSETLGGIKVGDGLSIDSETGVLSTTGASTQTQSDWNQDDDSAIDYIKNKPTSLPASDVKDWAKADEKPTYIASEVGALADSTTLADLSDDETHRLVTDTEKTTWNGKINQPSDASDSQVLTYDSSTSSWLAKDAQGGSSYTAGTDIAIDSDNKISYDDTAHRDSGTTVGANSHAEGSKTEASKTNSHAEGFTTHATGDYSHAEGEYGTASGTAAHAEGNYTTASGWASHAEGFYSKATNNGAHAEGYNANATDYYAHAEGEESKAYGRGAHAEGYKATASGYYSHSEGAGTTASGYYSHAEGGETTASKPYSHSEGNHTKASTESQHVQGKYNVEDTANIYAHIVGGGTSDTARKNIHTLDWSGNAVYSGSVTATNIPSVDTTKEGTVSLQATVGSDGTTTYQWGESSSGSGDMTKAVYDTDGNGVIDCAEGISNSDKTDILSYENISDEIYAFDKAREEGFISRNIFYLEAGTYEHDKEELIFIGAECSITIKGTPTATFTTGTLYPSGYITVGTYTFSAKGTYSARKDSFIALKSATDGTYVAQIPLDDTLVPQTFTLSSSDKFYFVFYESEANVEHDDLIYFQVEKGTKATEWAPYAESNQALTQTTNSLSKSQTIVTNLVRRTRNDITSNLANLSTAVAEQNLEKYGYTIGDYFTGASGYYYYLADLDHYYGGYNSYAIVGTHHIGIVVDTKQNSAWLSDGSATNYSSSTLHSYLTETVLPLIKSDLKTLFGNWNNHLICNTLLDNAVNGWGTAWTGLENCYIAAMSEVQMYGAKIFEADGNRTGTSVKQLALFRKYRWNEIYGNTSIWLRSLYSSSFACCANDTGDATYDSLGLTLRASGLILFK